MVDKAKTAGLQINTSMHNHLVLGKKRKGSKHQYVTPNLVADQHKSLRKIWWLAELLPKRKIRAETRKWNFLGFYLPCGERRQIPHDAKIHSSAKSRAKQRIDYKPSNMPTEQKPIVQLIDKSNT